MTILLIGPRCAGKTTVGALLAELLHRPFADLDAIIENHTGSKVADLLRDDPAQFREIEYQCFLSTVIYSDPSLVLAIGGGAVTHPASAPIFKFTVNIYLSASVKILQKRILNDTVERPPLLARRSESNKNATARELAAAEVAEVLAVRDPIYSAYADFILNTGDAKQVGCAMACAVGIEKLVSVEKARHRAAQRKYKL
ncbi:MAG: shikimate kinase [Planctomycetota bacterium]